MNKFFYTRNRRQNSGRCNIDARGGGSKWGGESEICPGGHGKGRLAIFDLNRNAMTNFNRVFLLNGQ